MLSNGHDYSRLPLNLTKSLQGQDWNIDLLPFQTFYLLLCWAFTSRRRCSLLEQELNNQSVWIDGQIGQDGKCILVCEAATIVSSRGKLTSMFHFFSSGIKPNVPTSPILEFSFWTLLPSCASPSCVESHSCVIIDCCMPSLRYATVLQVKFHKDSACLA